MFEHTQQIRKSLYAIYEQLNKNLSLDHLGFDIEYDKNNYYFSPPTTKSEVREQKKLRKRFITKLLKKCLKDQLKEVLLFPIDVPSSAWDSVISFSDEHLSSWDIIDSTELIPVDNEEVHQESSIRYRPLDQDSQYIHMQREGITFEDMEKFFESKNKSLFVSNSHNASMSDENSNS
jgi:hypothetical protein